jgi:hypothetical protein
MTSLVACLSTGKGTWVQVIKLINDPKWDKVFLVTNTFGQEHFKPTRAVEMILVDDSMTTEQLISHIKEKMEGISDFEVGVNITSGTGREHMAIIAAVLKMGLALRLVEIGDEGVKEI